MGGVLVKGLIVLNLMIIGLFLVMQTPLYITVRSSCGHGSSMCIASLKQIEGAKFYWAREYERPPWATPKKSDLFGPDKYIRQFTPCPQGGVINLGIVDEKPSCSVPEHHL